MTDPQPPEPQTQPPTKSGRKLYAGDAVLGRAPFTKWGARRLIEKHQDAIAYNLRLSQLLKGHREELLNGVLPYTVRGKVKGARRSELSTVVAALIGLGGAFALKKAGAPPFLAPLVAYGTAGWGLGKVTSIMREMRRYPEHAVANFVAPGNLSGEAREQHGALIDQTVTNLASVNDEHKVHIGALREWVAQRDVRRTQDATTKREAAERRRGEAAAKKQQSRLNAAKRRMGRVAKR